MVSLRYRLALSFGLLAGALAGVLSLVIGHYASDAARDQIGLYLTRLAIEYRDKLDASIAERKDEVAMLSRLDTALPDASSPERRRARIDQLMRNPDFAWIGYAAPGGRVDVASGRLLEGVNVSERPWFRAGLERASLLDAHEAVLLAKLLPPRAEPRRFVDIAVPIEGGRGVVGAHVDFAWAGRLRADIVAYSDSGSPFDLLLVQGDGTVLVGPEPLLGSKVPIGLGKRASAPAEIERWPDGEDYLVGGSASRGGLDWVILARKRRADAFAPITDLQHAILWAGLVLALGGIGAGWLLARRIARPLESLAAAAGAIAKGDHRTTLPRLDDNLEVAKLSEALRAMLAHLREQSESLREAQDHLELRVRERTAELVKLQAQLELEIADTMVARDDVARANERLALALEASNLALWDYDVERDQVYLGASWSQMLGGPAVETRTTSRALAQLVPEPARGRVIDAVQKTISGKQHEYRVEHPVSRKDGREFWIVSTGRVVERGADGRVLRILGTNRDITERVLATRAREEADERYRLAFDGAKVGMAQVGPDGRYQRVNRALCDLLGYSAEELLQKHVTDVTHPDDVESTRAAVREALAGNVNGFQLEKRYLRKDGSVMWGQLDAALIRDVIDLPLQFFSQIQDIGERRAAQEKVADMAMHDALTGLANSRLMEDRLGQALAQAHRTGGSVGVLYMDLDGFKPVNDNLGHAAGDAALKEVARRGVAVLRDSDTLARIGGDEFVAVLPGAARDALQRAAERMLAALAPPFELEGREAVIGASIGAAVAPAGHLDARALLQAADAAMYEAKRSGRNRICFHDPKTKEKPK